MALQSKVGSFALNTSTGNQSITGVGFQPTAIIFMYSRATADAGTANEMFGRGFAVSSSNRSAMYITGLNGSGTSDTDRHHTETSCISTIDNTDTVKEAADFVSMDADGFTINVTTATSAIIVSYLALGGSSLTNAKIIRFQSKTSTGSQGITGVGFQPDAIMLMGAIDSTVPPSAGSTAFIHQGFGVGTTGYNISSTSQNNATNNDRASQRTDRIVYMTSTGTTFYEASLTSLDADGFTLNWQTANGTGRQIYALCLKGGSYKLGNFNQPTSNGSQAITGVGFQPSSILLASFNTTTNSGFVNNSTNSHGLASSSSARAALAFGSVLNANPSTDSTYLDRTKVINMITPSGASPTVNATADLTSMDADGFTLNWSATDAIARQLIYMAFGPAPVITGPPSRLGLLGVG